MTLWEMEGVEREETANTAMRFEALAECRERNLVVLLGIFPRNKLSQSKN
jgi:hypothetical protein